MTGELKSELSSIWNANWSSLSPSASLYIQEKYVWPAPETDGQETSETERLVRLGGLGPLVTVKTWGFEVPPPGVGLVTVIRNTPAVRRSDAGMVAVNILEDTNTVVLAEPSKLTTELEIKLLPLTTIKNPGSPTFFMVGEILVVMGAGFPTVNVIEVDVPPPGAGLKTVTSNFPKERRSLAGIAAVSWVELTNVVVLSEPFHLVTEEEIKLLPLRVKVNAGPSTAASVGDMLVNIGTGLLLEPTVNLTALLVPPPGP